MVRAIRLVVATSLSFVTATQSHAPFQLPWETTTSSETTIHASTRTVDGKAQQHTPERSGQYRAYQQHALANLALTTLLTITTSEGPMASITPSSTLNDVQPRQLGGLLGLGGVVSNLLGAIQPALTSALAPIQSAANTNLAQISLVRSLAPQVVPTADVIGPAATAAGPVLAGLLGNIISAVAPIVSNIQGVVSQVALPIESLAAPIESAVAAPVQAAVAPLVSALAPAIAAALGPVGEAAGGIVQPVASNLLGPIESAVAPMLGAALSTAIGAIGDLENPVANALRPLLDNVDDVILPLASAAVSAVWPAIAPIVTPLNPVICALQPAEVPIGGNATALIPVQCVSVTSGNMVPVSTDVATVTSPQELLSNLPAANPLPLTSNGVPDRAALPISGIPGLPVPAPTTTIIAPLPSNPLGSGPAAATSNLFAPAIAGSGSNPLASVLSGLVSNPFGSAPSNNPLAPGLSSIANQLGSVVTNSNQTSSASGLLASIIAGAASNSVPSATGAVATNPLGSVAAAASSYLAGLGSASNFGSSLTLPSVIAAPGTTSMSFSPFSSAIATTAATASVNVPLVGSVAGGAAPTGNTGNLMTFTGAVTGVLTALPVVVPASVIPGNMGTTSSLSSANLPNIPFPAPGPPPPTTPLPVSSAPISIPPVGGTPIISSSGPSITPAPAALFGQSGLIMLAYGSQTITFAASQLPGGGLIASMSGNIYAFPASTLTAGVRRRDVTPQPDYEALALALVSLLAHGDRSPNQTTASGAQVIDNEATTPGLDVSIVMSTSAAGFGSSMNSSDSLSQTTQPTMVSSASSTNTDLLETTTDIGLALASASEQSSSSFASSMVTTSTTSSSVILSATTSSSLDSSSSGASLSIDSCPDINATSYLSKGGGVYQIICGINWIGRDIQPWRSTLDFDSCIAECDNLNAAARSRPCAAALFVPDAPATAANCYPKYSADDPTNTTGGYIFQAAVLRSSGNVVDNGFGLPINHAEEIGSISSQEKTDISNLTTGDIVDDIDPDIDNPVSGTELFNETETTSAPTSGNTLSLTSGSTFGGLNATGSGTSDNPVVIAANGQSIVYAAGTNVVPPLISTTLMLGVASNQPATQYFSANPTGSGSALARREIPAAASAEFQWRYDGPDIADSKWLPASLTLAPTPSETPHLWKRGQPVGSDEERFSGQSTVYGADRRSRATNAEMKARGPDPTPTAEAGWLPTAPPRARELQPRTANSGWLPTASEPEKETQHQIQPWGNEIGPSSGPVSSTFLTKSLDGNNAGLVKRQSGQDEADPNAYVPISNVTGANFALANNPIDSATGVLPSNKTIQYLIQDLTNIPHFSRDGGKGGMVANQHVFVFADTGVYTTEADGSNGHYIGYSSSSVASDLGQHGLFGNGLTLQDGIGEFADALGNLRGFAPLTIGETGFNEQALAAGVSSRYAVWPESSFIPLTSNTSIMYAPIVYDVVDSSTQSADFTYMGNTLLYITADDVAGPVAQRLLGRLFGASDVEWGCVGGMRSWGDSGVGGEDGMVYLFGNVRGGLLMARTNVTNIADNTMYEYWTGSAWTSGSLAPDSTAYVLEGSFMDIDIFYSPRHLTFLAVYTNIYGDNTVYWRYLQSPQAIVPSYAGGDPDSDIAEALTKYQWSDEQTLFQMGSGLNGDYSYAMGVHLGYFGQNDIANGGAKLLLSWISPTGQDPASRNSAYQLKNGVVTWT